MAIDNKSNMAASISQIGSSIFSGAQHIYEEGVYVRGRKDEFGNDYLIF